MEEHLNFKEDLKAQEMYAKYGYYTLDVINDIIESNPFDGMWSNRQYWRKVREQVGHLINIHEIRSKHKFI